MRVMGTFARTLSGGAGGVARVAALGGGHGAGRSRSEEVAERVSVKLTVKEGVRGKRRAV